MAPNPIFTHFWAIFPIFRLFFSYFLGEAGTYISPIFFSYFGPEARNRKKYQANGIANLLRPFLLRFQLSGLAWIL